MSPENREDREDRDNGEARDGFEIRDDFADPKASGKPLGGEVAGRREPVPRSRSGFIGRRFPRTGTEPITAQSALGLRRLLSLLFLPLFAALTVVFAIWWANSGAGDQPRPDDLRLLMLVCAGLTVFAAIDLAVIQRRLRRERGDL